MAAKSVIQFNIVVVVLFIVSKYTDAVDDCQTNQFLKTIDSTHMKFKKEYIMSGEFKSLHCCAKGYRSIEWFKNGQPYPWDSSLILYPKAENQTIYKRNVTTNDNGNYSCVIQNDTVKIVRVIQLTVEVDSPVNPYPTYEPQDQYAEEGSEARFFCEAFFGPTRLPDSENSISWFQQFDDNSEQKLESQEIKRDMNETIGALLIIPNVRPESYGRYVCRVGDGTAHSLEMKTWLFSSPVHAQEDSFVPAIVLALGAVAIVILLMLVIKYTSLFVNIHDRRDKKLCHAMNSSDVPIRIREVI